MTRRSQSGFSKKNEKAHAQDHLQWSRRDFMKTAGLTTSMGMILGSMPLKAFTSMAANFAGDTDNILVMIRLVGGNDALNTIVPIYDYGTYSSLRPTIGHKQSELINLTDEFAVPKVASDFKTLWDRDILRVINGIGYPDQNLSHFRSTDIWATAEPDTEINEGWLTRLITLDEPDILVDPPEHPSAIQIGSSGNLTFNTENNNNLSVNVSNIDQLFQVAEDGTFYSTDQLSDCLHGQQVEYLRNVANHTFRYADVIKQAYEASTTSVSYTRTQLADQLALIARLIKGGLRSSFYLITLNGFDTHADQISRQSGLLHALSTGMKEFYEDLASANVDKRVLSMTSSEFGRRPQQNSSGGTDHGAASKLFLFGPAVNGSGFVGDHPDLSDLDGVGNLKYSVDFRSVYSFILVNWLCFPESAVPEVLFQAFDPVDLGFTCSTTRTISAGDNMENFYVSRQSARSCLIHLTMKTTSRCSIVVYDSLGRQISILHQGLLLKGPHEYVFNGNTGNLSPGLYFVVMKNRGKISTRKFTIF